MPHLRNRQRQHQRAGPNHVVDADPNRRAQGVYTRAPNHNQELP